MRVSEWYGRLQTQLTADGFKVKFSQPDASDTLPLVHVAGHTDGDVSSHNGTLSSVDQQIDLYSETDISRADFEMLTEKLKWSLSRAGGWDSLTTQQMIDTSEGRDLYRALLLLTKTI